VVAAPPPPIHGGHLTADEGSRRTSSLASSSEPSELVKHDTASNVIWRVRTETIEKSLCVWMQSSLNRLRECVRDKNPSRELA
jgi:hypothetical protein